MKFWRFTASRTRPEGATIVRMARGAAALYFLDGVGTVVELIANDHLDNDAREPFSADSSCQPT